MDECILPPIAQIPRHASLIRAPADLDETVRELLHGTLVWLARAVSCRPAACRPFAILSPFTFL